MSAGLAKRGDCVSYIALATNAFDDVVSFYGQALGFLVVEQWDRPRGRGRRFDLGGGLRLEILDNAREPKPMRLDQSERVHVVVEVDDIEATWEGLSVPAPYPMNTSWGARLFQIQDPDGVPVTFLQWQENGEEK